MAREGLGPAAGVEGAESASSLVSFAFVFNLLIGAGALAIPRPFAQTGFVLAAPFLLCLCFLSLLTSLYMVETLVSVRLISQDPVGLRHAMGGKANPSSSAADAAARSEDEDLLLAGTNSINLSAPVEESGGRRRRQGASGDAPERVPLLEDESSQESLDSAAAASSSSSREAGASVVECKNLEMGALAKKLFSPLGSKVTYAVLCLYLFGDLSIYAVTIPKSLTALVCPHQLGATPGVLGQEDWPCSNFQGSDSPGYLRGLTSRTVYRSFVVALGLVQLPFMFQTVQKTLFIQVLSICYRWSAFFIMAGICVHQMLGPGAQGNDWRHFTRQRDYSGLMQLFGVTIYSFMCHHSLPSLLNPVMARVPKQSLSFAKIAKPVATALTCCLLVYLLLNTIVTLRFMPREIEDVITLNFQNFRPHFVSVFLELFPVCTLGASFPIIACTLRNNLQTLMLMAYPPRQGARRDSGVKLVEEVVLPLVVLALPLVVAFCTENVEMLVGLTGSYGGCAIEFVIPTLLVIQARKRLKQHEQTSGGAFATPRVSLGVLGHKFFVNLVLVWSAACLVLVTLNHLEPQHTR